MGSTRTLIDISYLREMSDNCPRFMAEVINVFKEQVPDLIAMFRSGLDRKDTALMKSAAHKAKNAMSVMGVTVMVSELHSFEEADLSLMSHEDFIFFILNFENVCHQTINELDLVLENISAHT